LANSGVGRPIHERNWVDPTERISAADEASTDTVRPRSRARFIAASAVGRTVVLSKA
jgi:hypothetical protein